MDLAQSIKNIDSNLLVFLLTSLIAFISWVVKGAIEKPINESKSTFEKVFNNRIEILTEIKNRLCLILYFENNQEESEKFKKEIQKLLLQDGRSAYLSKETLDNSLRISIDEENDKELIKKTINKINIELYKIISKVEDEIHFYRKFSNYNPIKRSIGIVSLVFQNIAIILLIGMVAFFSIKIFVQNGVLIKLLVPPTNRKVQK